jgi:hypothetical protein
VVSNVASILRRYGLDENGTELPKPELSDEEIAAHLTTQHHEIAWTRVRPAVVRVARIYADFVEVDDLAQEVALWWYGRGKKYVNRYIYREELAKLGKAVYKVAVEYAEKEKAARSGYRPEDNVVYSKQQIKDLIPLAIDIEAMANTTPVAPEGPHAKGNLAEGGNLLASVVDVRRGIEKLDPDQRRFLQMADDCEYDWELLGTTYEIQADSADQRFDRIAGRIAKFLSGEVARG